MRTAAGNGSTSAKKVACHPSPSHARLAASTPLQILPYFMLFSVVKNSYLSTGVISKKDPLCVAVFEKKSKKNFVEVRIKDLSGIPGMHGG